ncbi:MAG: OB-fold nucleic acid binding domain-containing protein [Polyangiaceae bacterium]
MPRSARATKIKGRPRFGWVASYRDHGGCVFVDLRDREGITQLVFDPDLKGFGDAPKAACKPRRRSAPSGSSAFAGKVVSRGGNNKNPRLATGEIEVHAAELTVFNKADTPPFGITDELVQPRSAFSTFTSISAARPCRRARSPHQPDDASLLRDQGFLELETPFMVKYTPGGA